MGNGRIALRIGRVNFLIFRRKKRTDFRMILIPNRSILLIIRRVNLYPERINFLIVLNARNTVDEIFMVVVSNCGSSGLICSEFTSLITSIFS